MGTRRRPWALPLVRGVPLAIRNLSGLQSPYRLHETTSPCPGGHLKSTCVVSLNYRFLGPILGMGNSGM